MRGSRVEQDRKAVLDGYSRSVNPGLAKIARLMTSPIVVRGCGAHVWDAEGDRYLDCGGHSVFFLGHCHPDVVGRVDEQLHRLPITTPLTFTAELPEAARELLSVAPPGLEYAFFTNSGAEACEVALKLGRLNGRRRVVAMENGFHGRTLGALSVTGKAHYREPFRPLLPDVTFVPFGDVGAVEDALRERGEETLVITEPVQAEAGVRIPPAGWLREVADVCHRYGALLAVDEIQTGLGRLGSWWGCSAESVTPDMVLAGKALGGGVVPIGCVLATASVFGELIRDPLLITSTFAGNPLAAAAATATIQVIQRDGLIERANKLGTAVLQRVESAMRASARGLRWEVRGRGLLVALEFGEQFLAGELLLELMQRKVLVSPSGNALHVIRFTPSVLLDGDDLDHLEMAVRQSVEALVEAYPELAGAER